MKSCWGLLIIVLAATLGCSASHVPDSSTSLSSQAPLEDASAYFTLVAESQREKLVNKSASFTYQDYNKSLRSVSIVLLGRDLLSNEMLVEGEGLAVYSSRVQAMLDAPEALTKLRGFFNVMFEMSGTAGGVNYEEPSNLALYLVKANLDFREILKADYCVNDALEKVPCSAFANDQETKAQAAGALTTKAFLVKWDAAFNFLRVAKAFKTFACSEYPDSTDVGLPAEVISSKAKEFNCVNCEPACYSCHNTMNPRAILFYDFTPSGVFMPNPTRTADRAKTDTGVVSSRDDILVTGTQPTYHGKPINSVKDYALKLADSRKFRDCTAQRLTNLMIGANQNNRIPAEFESIRNDVTWNSYNIKKILLEIATHPKFIRKASPL